MIRLYHGSENIVEVPVYGFGKSNNDYGLGFYCTESLDMAKEWSVRIDEDGYANIYDLDISDLSVLNLNNPEYCILHWLTILLQNRTFDTPSTLANEAKEYLLKNFRVDYEAYDIIIGYRADDSYFSYAQDFINGTISYRQLSNAMMLGELGRQVVLKSEMAFSKIQFVGYEQVPHKIWFEKKDNRDKKARHDYFDKEKLGRQKGDIYITQILDEEMGPYDERLRQIVSRKSQDLSR